MITTQQHPEGLGELVTNKNRLYFLESNSKIYKVRFSAIKLEAREVKMATPNESDSFYFPFEDIPKRLTRAPQEQSWLRRLLSRYGMV